MILVTLKALYNAPPPMSPRHKTIAAVVTGQLLAFAGFFYPATWPDVDGSIPVVLMVTGITINVLALRPWEASNDPEPQPSIRSIRTHKSALRFSVRDLLIVAACVAVCVSAMVAEDGFFFRFLPFAAFFCLYANGKRSDQNWKQVLSELAYVTMAMVVLAIAVFYFNGLIAPDDSVGETIRRFVRPMCAAAVFAFIGGALGAYWSTLRRLQRE
jgi:hypothetical protein